jgi:endonuclease/exonuclease/phosphatase family metal-dependent hydrolase
MRGAVGAVLVAGAVAIGPRCPPARAPAPAVATFNIENFPRSDQQVRAAFASIRSLGAPVVALQEVTDAQALQAAVTRELGPSWGIAVSSGSDSHRLAVLWDDRVVTLRSVRSRDETRVIVGAKPILEVRLRDRRGQTTRMLTVHLKAGGEASAPVRAAQLARVDAAVADGEAAGDRVVLLGDFNATTPADRAAIAALAARTGLSWATDQLACTSYWDRSDGCVGVALDHVLTSGGGRAAVGGACATEGCDRADRCPSWRWEVSDHCPVVLTAADD